ncbi:tellurite resistance TerB family protein [Parapedomonas caeni]
MTGQPISMHTALIYLMIVVAGSDRSMSDNELKRIGRLVQDLPVFAGFNIEHLIPTARDCGSILDAEEGLTTVLGIIRESVPEEACETAYCLACDVAAADDHLGRFERSILDTVRATLGIERLAASAIERAAAARWWRPAR